MDSSAADMDCQFHLDMAAAMQESEQLVILAEHEYANRINMLNGQGLPIEFHDRSSLFVCVLDSILVGDIIMMNLPLCPDRDAVMQFLAL
jgi:hypothetical protein